MKDLAASDSEDESIDHAVPGVAMVLLLGSLVYGAADILRPGNTSLEIPYYGLAVAIPLLALLIHRLQLLPALPNIIATDLTWTALVALGMYVAPNATISGTAYVLSLKWLGSALLLPWPVRVQQLSSVCGLVLYFIALVALERDTRWFVHQWALPPVAALLSVFGARLLQRGRARARQQAATIEQSEQQLRHLLDVSPDGMFVCRRGAIVFANQRLLQHLGRSGEAQLLHRPTVELVVPGDRARFEAFLAAAAALSSPSTSDYVHFATRDGSLPVTVSAVPMLFQGEPGIQGTVRETNPEERNLILLEGERRVLEKIASGSTLGEQLTSICAVIERLEPNLRTSILLASPDGTTLHHGAAPRMERSFLAAIDGLAVMDGSGTCGTAAARREQVVAENVLEDAAWASYRELARDHDIAACCSTPILTTNGELLGTFASYSRTVGGPSPEWVRIVQHATHLARVAIQRSRMEQERGEQSQLFSTLAEVGRVLISSLDQPLLLQRLCDSTRAALQAEISHVYLVDPEDGAFIPMAGAGDTPEQWDRLKVVRIPRPLLDDVLRRVESADSVEISAERNSHLLPPGLQAANGIYSGLFVALRRGHSLIGTLTTGHRSAAPPFSEHQHRMARGIAQLASLALHNSRLIEELDRANRIKSNFVATMSHELRTPLNVLIGYQDLLLDGEVGLLNEEQRGVVERLSHYSRQLLLLVNDTLDLSRLESGKVEIQAEPIDMGGVLARLRTETEEAWGDRGLALDFAWDEGLLVWSDSAKLHVVLRCLIANAVKFTAAGTITVRARRKRDEMEVLVADTGIGIAPESRERIFEPFTQATPNISERFGGAGLGLHIVKRFLDILGGRVAVESTIGIGSTFRICLPIADPLPQAVVREPAGDAALPH